MHSLCALEYKEMHCILVFEVLIKEEKVVCIQDGDSFRLPYLTPSSLYIFLIT